MRRNTETYYPEATLLDEQIGNYRVLVNKLGVYAGEEPRYKVTLFNKYTRVEYAAYDTEEMAMRLARYWLDEIIPIQLAKEAHGLAKELKPERVSDAETTYQP